MERQLGRIGKYVLSVIVLVMMIAQSFCNLSEVKADDNVGLEINGYQISTNLEAFRTVYSVVDPSEKVAEVGLIYGLTEHITEADMVVGSTNKMVYSFAATDAGKSELCYSDSENAQTYVLTMKFVKNAKFFKDAISVKPYAKLKDGTLVYGKTSSNSVYKIADTLYQKQLMGSTAKHDYLFDNILSVVNPSYQKKDFSGSSSIVRPGTVGDKETTSKTENPETTSKYEDTTNHAVDGSLEKPVGLTYAGNADLPYYFAWAPVNGCDSFDVYVNGKYVTNVTGTSVNLDASVFTKGAGEYTVGVGAVFGNKVSEATVIPFTYTGEIITTEKQTEAPTQPQQPETTKNTQQPETSAGGTDFTTDSSIPMPFGMDLKSNESGYLTVVWGRGDIDCYNIYVDGERRRTGVKAQSITMPVYFEGTHTVAIATVVDKRESKRLEMSIAVNGIGEKETEPETCPPELQPQLRSDVPLRDDRVLIQLNNKTNGKYSNNQVYWCILGYNDAKQLCYMDKDGNLIPANLGMNNVKVGDRMVANVSHTLSESDHVYAPSIESGRMYLSYEKPIYITFNQAADGRIGFAGPDLNNTSDPNVNTLFEFAEFTITGKNYWGNTTRVDFFSFPMITRLVGHTQYEKYDKTVGDIGTRDEIFASFRNNAPAAFKPLADGKRIICPCKSVFNAGQPYANYFDGYINEFWAKYSNENLVFNSEAGSFTGRVVGNRMQFTRAGDSTIYYIDKPSTQDVLEGKGAFDRGNLVELAIEAQLCAAFNRGVATEPSKWYKPKEYYKNSINNYYAGFFHNHSVVGLAYGFCYDDVNDQSTLLQYDNADALIIDLKW